MIWFVCLALTAAAVGVYAVGTMPLSARPRAARSITRLAGTVFLSLCVLGVGFAVAASV